jgi:RNA polymerase sigma-70 factor (ECF subfamily)
VAREAHLTIPDAEGDERRLVEAAQKDPARFAELYAAHFERVYAYAARRLHDRQEAEDVTSEVFHQALANLPRFEWRGVPFAAWLFRIAANAIADRWQRRDRERGGPPPELAAEPRLEEVEEQARLIRLVGRLPGDQRRVVEMRFVEQKSIREIAAELGRSEGAVKQLQFRALSELRRRMGRGNA